MSATANTDSKEGIKISKSFLYVDDDQRLFTSIKRYSDHFGVAMQTATSVQNALALIQSSPEKYFLVLTDQYMPGSNGDVLLEQIKNKYPFIRRAMISGDETSESISKGYDTGKIFRYLRKPIKEEDIRQLLADACKDVLSETGDDGNIIHDRQYLIYSSFHKIFDGSEFKDTFPDIESEMLKYYQRVWQVARLSRLPLIDKESAKFSNKLGSAIMDSMANVKELLESSKDSNSGFLLSAMFKQFNITGLKKIDRYAEFNEPVFSALIQKFLIYYDLMFLDPQDMIKVSTSSVSIGLGDPLFYNDIFNPILEVVPKGIEIAALSIEIFMILMFLNLPAHAVSTDSLAIHLRL